jgi:hypothetical protein
VRANIKPFAKRDMVVFRATRIKAQFCDCAHLIAINIILRLCKMAQCFRVANPKMRSLLAAMRNAAPLVAFVRTEGLNDH